MTRAIIVGTRKGLFRIEPGAGGRWQIAGAAFLGDHVSMSLADQRDGALYAALNLGHFGAKLHRSVDGGSTWSEIACPAYPPQPEGLEEKDGFGKPLPWKVQQIWSLEADGADEPGALWCGTIPGGLFQSTDRGDSWNLVDALWNHPDRKQWFGGGADLPGIHSIAVDPRDSRRVNVGVSCGGVWATSDGGQSWACRADGMWAAYMPPDRKYDPVIQDPHRLVQCPAAPEQCWVQHHNGIFRTTDGCASWQEVPSAGPSTFGFAVAVHPRDPNTAWFIPAQSDERRVPVDARVVVTRMRDGGASFDVLSQGLPRESAYDIVFRHALDIDAAGETLAFGSTTGSLWVSHDQGDSWQSVSEHLPPVYCVRFVD